MFDQRSYRGLNFEIDNQARTQASVPTRWLVIGGITALYILCWLILSPGTTFLISVVGLVILLWVARFGIRLALIQVRDYLNDLIENMGDKGEKP